jgi:integrase
MARLAKNTLPNYRLHKPTGQAVVTLSGKDFYLGLYDTKESRAAYDRLTGEWQANGRRLPDEPSQAPAIEVLTVVMLCAAYLRHAKAYYRKDGEPTNTVLSIKAAIRYLRDMFGRLAAEKFGPLALQALQQRMIDDGLSRSYINDHTGRIKRIWKWAVSQELVPPATYQALATVRGLSAGRTSARETAPVLPVDDAVVDATLPYLPEVVADMVRLQRVTGMRPDEICRLRPCDLDRGGDVWQYRPARHKTQHHGRERVVLIGAEGQAVLLRYLARDAKSFCFRPCDSESKRLAALHEARVTPLTCGNVPGSNRRHRPKFQPGERYSPNVYRKAISRACDKAFPHPTLSAIKPKDRTTEQAAELLEWQRAHQWAPNQLRHTFATKVRRQFGLEAAQVMLGHSNAAITQVYAERDLAKGVLVAKAIG